MSAAAENTGYAIAGIFIIGAIIFTITVSILSKDGGEPQ